MRLLLSTAVFAAVGFAWQDKGGHDSHDKWHHSHDSSSSDSFEGEEFAATKMKGFGCTMTPEDCKNERRCCENKLGPGADELEVRKCVYAKVQFANRPCCAKFLEMKEHEMKWQKEAYAKVADVNEVWEMEWEPANEWEAKKNFYGEQNWGFEEKSFYGKQTWGEEREDESFSSSDDWGHKKGFRGRGSHSHSHSSSSDDRRGKKSCAFFMGALAGSLLTCLGCCIKSKCKRYHAHKNGPRCRRYCVRRVITADRNGEQQLANTIQISTVETVATQQTTSHAGESAEPTSIAGEVSKA